MPVHPNALERLLFRLNKVPAPALDLLGASAFRAAQAARRLGVFATLADADGRLTAADLADRIDADARGVAALLDFLARTGYVGESDGRYRNARAVERWLRDGSADDLGDWFAFWDELVFPFWDAHLETAIREGGPPLTIYEWCDRDPDRWAVAQAGFRAAARLTVDEVCSRVDLPDDARRLLDVGGGHALFSVELCRRHSELRATVLDREVALDAARETLADADQSVAERVDLRTGDYFDADLDGGYDVALLFNVVHAHDPVENEHLVGRVADALAPGGRLVVLDQFEGTVPTPTARASAALLGLTYLVTMGGRVYRAGEASGWLRAAGLANPRRRNLRSTPGVSLVVAEKR